MLFRFHEVHSSDDSNDHDGVVQAALCDFDHLSCINVESQIQIYGRND